MQLYKNKHEPTQGKHTVRIDTKIMIMITIITAVHV